MDGSRKPAVVVTGASTGIGEACAELLAASGYFVFGAVRKPSDAEKLAQKLGENFAPLLFDVTDAAAVEAAAKTVEDTLGGETLAGLINNAGIALPAPLLHQPIDEFRRQIEVNLTGQLLVTQAFAPLLGAGPPRAGKPGRIVMMSSVAGSLASPFMGAYCASKYALEGLSDALRRELMVYGVDVVIIEPGVIRTPIWDKAEQNDFSRFDATPYGPAARKMEQWALAQGREGPPPRLVADAALRALRDKSPPARIRVVPGFLINFLLPRLIPARILDWLIAKKLGFLQRPRPAGG